MKKVVYVMMLSFLFACNQKSPFDLLSSSHTQATDTSGQGVVYPPLSVVEDEPEGSNCEYGGQKIEVGKDKNTNGKLEASELSSVKYVCNEQGEFKALVIDMKEPEGPNCEYGGKVIKSGLDINANGILDSHEVLRIDYACNGKPVYKVLTEVIEEPAGENCSLGGKKIITGEDVNSNDKLEDPEIESYSYKCDKSEDFKVLVVETPEPVGENCEFGGKLISSGLDLNRNDVLEDNEISDSKYFCSKETDFKILVETLEEPVGDNCPLGGKKIINGYDVNQSGALDEKEIKGTMFRCNTEADFEVQTLISNIEFGSADCALGGQKVYAGLDLNKNGHLDTSEIDNSKTVLNCLTQNDFADVIRISEIAFGSTECPLGGQKMEKGKDYNSNGLLDDNEVSSSTVTCKSNTDFNSLLVIREIPVKDAKCPLGGKESVSGFDYNYNGVMEDNEINKDSITQNCYTEADYSELAVDSEEPMGKNCKYGGTKIEKGLDINKDGVLNLDEINTSLTNYNCLGPEDFNTLVIVSEEPFASSNCALGGKITERGLDLNRDGLLADNEIENTTFDCYQPEHFNLLNRITEEPEGASCSLGGKKIEQGRDYNGNGSLDDDELDPGLITYNCYSPLDFNLLSKVSDVAKGPECKLGGTRIEKGRDINSNGILDDIEKDPSLTSYICTASFENSRMSAGATRVASGSSTLVTLTLVDELGINIKRAGINVGFAVKDGGSSLGEFAPVIDNGDGTYSSLFTGFIAGTPVQLTATVEGKEIITDKPYLTVVGGTASSISIENKSDGTGSVVDVASLAGMGSITLYAVSRDVKGNFVANEAVNWTVSGNIGSLSSTTGPSVTLSPKPLNGTGSISITHETLGSASTGQINVSWPGLVASLSFEGDLVDSSGKGNDAVNYGATFVEGKKGKGLLFNGMIVSGMAYYPHVTIKNNTSIGLTTAGTTAAWVYMNKYTDYGGIIMKGNNTDFKDEAYSLQLYSNSQKLTMNVKDRPNKDNSVYSGNNVLGIPPTGKWMFVVGTWDPTGIRIYVNAVEKGYSSKAVTAQTTTADLHIGSQVAGAPYPKGTDGSAFVGKIDEVSIWNRALSPEEITYLYNEGNAR